MRTTILLLILTSCSSIHSRGDAQSAKNLVESSNQCDDADTVDGELKAKGFSDKEIQNLWDKGDATGDYGDIDAA